MLYFYVSFYSRLTDGRKLVKKLNSDEKQNMKIPFLFTVGISSSALLLSSEKMGEQTSSTQ